MPISPTYTRSRSPLRRLARCLLRLRYRNFNPDAQPRRAVRVSGLNLIVLPQVFNPALHFTSAVFAGFLRRRGARNLGGSVLDLGTGTGLLAIVAALSGAGQVVAVDVSPEAVKCASLNVARYGLGQSIEVRQGDGFVAVASERFDVVLCNPPYFRGEPATLAQRAFLGGSNLEWFTNFGRDLHYHLNSGGHALISLGDAAEIDLILSLLRECGWRVDEVARRDILVERIYLFKLTPLSVVENQT